MNAQVNTVGQCKCELGPIVRYINFKVMEGAKTVFLDEFKDKLSACVLDRINECLSRHGFKGVVKVVDDYILYGQ